MAFIESKIGRIFVKEQAAWGTAASSFADANCVEASVNYPQIVTEAISAETVKGSYYHSNVSAGSQVGATFTISKPLSGWSASTPSGHPTEHVDGLLLRHALGASTQGSYSTNQPTGATTSQITVTTGTDHAIGGAVLVPTQSSNTAHAVGWVRTNSATTADFAAQLPAAGSTHASGVIYGSNTCYLTSGVVAVPLTVRWMGAVDGACIDLYDAVVTACKITATPKGQPMLEVELFARNWANRGTGGAPGVYAYTLPQMRPIMETAGQSYACSRLMTAADNTTTPTAYHAFSYEMNVAVEYAQILSHSAVEGVHRLHPTNREATISVTTAQDTTISTATPGTNRGVMQLDLVGPLGASLSILCPSAMLASQESISDNEGVIATTSEYVPAAYTGDTSSTNAGNSILRVAFL